MSKLSDFQLAVLNEMGLTLFVSPDKLAPVHERIQADNVDIHETSHSNNEAANQKISALRETLSSKDVNTAKSEMITESKINTRPLAIVDEGLIRDIKLALASVDLPTPDEKNWFVSDSEECELSQNNMVLPFDIRSLSAQKKKQLWTRFVDKVSAHDTPLA